MEQNKKDILIGACYSILLLILSSPLSWIAPGFLMVITGNGSCATGHSFTCPALYTLADRSSLVLILLILSLIYFLISKNKYRKFGLIIGFSLQFLIFFILGLFYGW